MDWQALINHSHVSKLISTLVLLAVVLVLRSVVVRKIMARDMHPTQRRQLIVRIRNVALFLMLAIVFVIWLEQLRNIAATVVVIAAAIVIALKEFLLNIVGYIYRTSYKYIDVGDRIEIGAIRGDVIDQNMMGITLLEIGPNERTHQYTGLSVFVPNSLFLSAPVKNENFMWKDYVFHLVTVPIPAEANWSVAEKALLQAATEVCAPYSSKAREAMSTQAMKQSLEEPTIEPRVQIQIVEPDTYQLVLRLPVPSRKRGRIEQQITRRYLLLQDAAKSESAEVAAAN
jgi:small-conductance mechanosensitive channel